MPDDHTVRVVLLLDLGVLLNIIEHLDDIHASIILVGFEWILHVLPRIVILLIDSVKQAFLYSTYHNCCLFGLTVMADMSSKTSIRHANHVIQTHRDERVGVYDATSRHMILIKET